MASLLCLLAVFSVSDTVLLVQVEDVTRHVTRVTFTSMATVLEQEILRTHDMFLDSIALTRTDHGNATFFHTYIGSEQDGDLWSQDVEMNQGETVVLKPNLPLTTTLEFEVLEPKGVDAVRLVRKIYVRFVPKMDVDVEVVVSRERFLAVRTNMEVEGMSGLHNSTLLDRQTALKNKFSVVIPCRRTANVAVRLTEGTLLAMAANATSYRMQSSALNQATNEVIHTEKRFSLRCIEGSVLYLEERHGASAFSWEEEEKEEEEGGLVKKEEKEKKTDCSVRIEAKDGGDKSHKRVFVAVVIAVVVFLAGMAAGAGVTVAVKREATVPHAKLHEAEVSEVTQPEDIHCTEMQ